MNNQEIFEWSKRLLVGGVNSPVRAISPYPFFVARAEGPNLYDEEGNSYVDYCLAYGPMILGHGHPAVRQAVTDQLEEGWCYGTPTVQEIEYARFITDHVANVDKVRCVNTGTEATMNAVRLARGFTDRDKIIKVEGAFHGAHDAVLVKAGSGALTHSVPDSKGIPEDVTRNTILIPFNDIPALETALEENEGEVAAMITEPAIGNAGCILPREGYLTDVRALLHEHGSLLILDEVITGFRLGLGGAQEYFGVDADIVTMGKVVGGGFPIGVLGARHEIMDRMTPGGDIYNAGTFNGHPVSIAAGLAALRTIKDEGVLPKVAATGEEVRRGLTDIVEDLGLGYQVQGLGPMFQVYFNDEPVWDLADAKRSRADLFLTYCAHLRDSGVFLPPSQFECCFVSLAHDDETVRSSLERFGEAMGKIESG